MNAPTPHDDDLTAEDMSARLTDTFDAMAATYVPVTLDAAALWADGRKDRRRDLLQLVAAVAVFVLLLTCTVFTAPVQLVPATAPDADSAEAGALPRVVHLPTLDDDLEVLDAFPAGRVSLALTLDPTFAPPQVLLVDAVDGAHHVVKVPDLDVLSTGDSAPGLWLSPDGWHLAYPTLTRPAAGVRAAGLAVVDLRTGRVTTAPTGLPDATGTRVTSLAWSPDSTTMVWAASTFDTSGAESGDVTRLGVGAPSAPVGPSVAVPRTAVAWDSTPALSSDGTVVLASSGRRTTWRLDGDALTFVATHEVSGPSPDSMDDGGSEGGVAFTPDGSRVVAGMPYGGLDLRSPGTLSHPTSALLADDGTVVAGEVEKWRLDVDPESDGIDPSTRLVGITPDGALLLQSRFPDTFLYRAGSDTDLLPVLVELRESGGSGGHTPTLATALADRDTVDFAPPPWARDRAWIWWGLGALAAAVAVVVRAARFRRPSRSRGEKVSVSPPSAGPTLGFATGFFATTAILGMVALAVLPLVLGVLAVAALALFAIRWSLTAWGTPALRGSALRGSAPGGTPRGRVLSLSVVLVLAVVATVWVAAPLRPYAPSVTVAEGALPSVVEEPIGRALHLSSGMRGATDLATVGRLSVVAAQTGRLSLGVSATNGRHVMLDAADEDFYSRMVNAPVAALSPDGWTLVTAFEELGETTDATRTGLRFIDLSDGSERKLTLRGVNGRPVDVEQAAFSPDGGHLVWFGDEMTQHDQGGSGSVGNARTVGVTRLDELTDSAWRIARAIDNSAVAVSNDGVARVLVGRRLVTVAIDSPDVEADVRRVAPSDLGWSGAVVNPAGTELVVGTSGNGLLDTAESGLHVLDLTALDDEAGSLPPSLRPHGWLPEGAPSVRPLGWSPSGRLVASVDGGSFAASGQIVAITLAAPPTGPAAAALTYEAELLSVTEGTHSTLAVATDLADSEPQEFGEQRWSVTDERLWGIGIAAAVTLWLLVLLVRAGIAARRPARREVSDSKA